MRKKTIRKAEETINSALKQYQVKLSEELEKKAEAKFMNGNIECDSSINYEFSIQRYEMVISDLRTIKSAIKNNKESVRTWSSTYTDGDVYCEIENVMREAGFNIYNASTTLILHPFEEYRY